MVITTDEQQLKYNIPQIKKQKKVANSTNIQRKQIQKKQSMMNKKKVKIKNSFIIQNRMIMSEKLPNTYQDSMNKKQFNTAALTVWAEDRYFYLVPNFGKSMIPTILKIDRKSQEIKEIKVEEFGGEGEKEERSCFYCSFFIGIININKKKILMLSQQVLLVCTINKRDIFKITKPIFVFYRPEDKKNINDEQAMILVNLMMIFEQGMYFSYAYNLTQPLHHIKKIGSQKYSICYNWAYSLQQQLIHCNKMWSLPVIQGFINKIQLYINAQKLKLILISRRNIYQGGPWQYTSGISEKGDAANFVQTQQIFAVNDFLFSFVQVRGSTPIYWTQKFMYRVSSGVTLKGTFEQNMNGFKHHIDKLLKNREYNNIILLNLLNKESSSQKKLIQNYQKLLKQYQHQKTIKINNKNIGIYYYYYDMHINCVNKNYSNFNKFISNQLLLLLSICGFTTICVKQDKSYQIITTQKGIIRTNCGTCVDRTNIAQSRLAAYQLVYILEHINMNINSFNKNLEFVDNDLPFSVLYRNLWADNADNISKQYTGTGSTESYAIRIGKLSYMATIGHGLTSLVRAIRTIRQEDEQKNRTVLFLLKEFERKQQKNQQQNIEMKPQKKQQKETNKKSDASKQMTKINFDNNNKSQQKLNLLSNKEQGQKKQ